MSKRGKDNREFTIPLGNCYWRSDGWSYRAQAAGGADTTTSQSDSTGSAQKAKKEHPEAPDTAIGMQDERGGKGAY